MGRSRGGLTTKVHAAVDAKGLPIRLSLTAGQAHDNQVVPELPGALPEGSMVLADRAYDADWIRKLINGQGAWDNIPPKSNRKEKLCFSPYLYRDRNLIERFFNIGGRKIIYPVNQLSTGNKHFRRIATRYDKLASNYMAMIKLAAIRIWLRYYETTA